MEDRYKLIALLTKQNLYFQLGFWNRFPNGIVEGIPTDPKEREEHKIKSEENEKKVADAVKLYLMSYPLVFTDDIESALRYINDLGHEDENGKLISPEEGGKSILYDWTNGNANGRLAKPVFGKGIGNKYFVQDPEIGYMLVQRGLEEVIQTREMNLPCQLFTYKRFPSLHRKLTFNSEGKYEGKTQGREFIIYLDHKDMLEFLDKELDRRTSLTTDTYSEARDLFYKRVHKK